MKKKTTFAKRALRVRSAIRKKAGGRLRLSVFKSCRHIYAQIIDDSKGVTVAAVSTLSKELNLTKTHDKAAAQIVGDAIAKKALAEGVKEVVFDKGAYLYHGKVQVLADAARAAGLNF